MSFISQPTGADFSVASIVQTIHRTVVHQTYRGQCKADPANIANLATLLQDHIHHTINQAMKLTSADTVDWEAHVFLPIIAGFDIIEDLGISKEDAEYVVLLSTVVIVAHQVLLESELSYHDSTFEFLIGIFDQYFREPEICHQTILRLKEEERRLSRAGASFQAQHAADVLCKLMPDMDTRSDAWNMLAEDIKKNARAKKFSSFRYRIDMELKHCAALSSASTVQPSPHLTTFPRDIRIQIFLKPGCSMDFDLVESVTEFRGGLTVQSCVGLRTYVEPGYMVSETLNRVDTHTLHKDQDSDDAKFLAATVIVPPGYFHRIKNINIIGEKDVDLSQMLIETDSAMVNVYNGDYKIRPTDQPRSWDIVSKE